MSKSENDRASMYIQAEQKVKPWFHDIKAIYRWGVMWFESTGISKTVFVSCVCDIIN